MKEFVPLFYADKLRIENINGDIGVVCFWSKQSIYDKLEYRNKERVAVVGNLYGNGIPEMLRNLLYNPQIKYLLFVGTDLGSGKQDLIDFFDSNFDTVNSMFKFKSGRKIDCLVTPSMLNIKLIDLDTVLEPVINEINERVIVDLPKVQISNYPSLKDSHQVIGQHPMDCYTQLLFKLKRFGQLKELKKGQKIELLNVKCVILNNEFTDLGVYGFDPLKIKQYMLDILNPVKPEDIDYTYGNRIRAYFGFDMLDEVVKRLNSDIEDRSCYITTWDKKDSMAGSKGHPCLVSLFFRFHDGKLNLSANFRTHNAVDGWPLNVYGMFSILNTVCNKLSLTPGYVTTYSHSISIDPKSMLRVDEILSSVKKRKFKPDFTGNLVFEPGPTVKHYANSGELLTTYEGTIDEIKNAILKDQVCLDISHAMYVGQELEKLRLKVSP
jgi:thymidylate synthase